MGKIRLTYYSIEHGSLGPDKYEADVRKVAQIIIKNMLSMWNSSSIRIKIKQRKPPPLSSLNKLNTGHHFDWLNKWRVGSVDRWRWSIYRERWENGRWGLYFYILKGLTMQDNILLRCCVKNPTPSPHSLTLHELTLTIIWHKSK